MIRPFAAATAALSVPLFLSLSTGSARAELIQFQFSGAVTSSTVQGVAVGELVHGSFAYDTSRAPTVEQFGDTFVASYAFSGAPYAIAATIGSHEVRTSQLLAEVTDNYGRFVDNTLHLRSQGSTWIDDTEWTQGTFGLTFESEGSIFNDSLALPTRIDLSQLPYKYGWLTERISGLGQQTLYFEFSSITAVPEPSGMPLSLLGLAITAGFFRRRRG